MGMFNKSKKEKVNTVKENKSSLIIRQINDPEEGSRTPIHTGLGITDKRLRELISATTTAFQSSNTMGDALHKASHEAKHANELFIISMTMLECKQLNNNPMDMLNKLSQIMKANRGED